MRRDDKLPKTRTSARVFAAKLRKNAIDQAVACLVGGPNGSPDWIVTIGGLNHRISDETYRAHALPWIRERWPKGKPTPEARDILLHPATDQLVDRFALALKEKLLAAQRKSGWQDEWSNIGWQNSCIEKLAEHVEKGDPLDVAAYAAFCWHHGWPTAHPRDPNALLDEIPAHPFPHHFAYFIYGREGSDVHEHGCMFARIFGVPEVHVEDDWRPGLPWKLNTVYTTTLSPLQLPRHPDVIRIDFSQVSIPGVVDVTDPLPRHHHFTCGTDHVRAQAVLQLLRPALTMGNQVDNDTIEHLSHLVEKAGLDFAAKIVGFGLIDEDVPF